MDLENFKFNQAQNEAIAHLNGPLLILAGAGTGKTSVLVGRMANIIASNMAMPWQILAVTFTNKAASEMKQRVQNLTNHSLSWLGTFHSIAARILRNHAELVGLDTNFVIIDVDDQLKMIKLTMEELNLDQDTFSPKIIYSNIQQWKEKGIVPENLRAEDITNETLQQAAKTYRRYQTKMLANNAVDFGDLLLKNIELFKTNSEIIDHYHQVFKYILVDEYQDTNTSQYIWLRMLAQNHHNICCVGDDDQSIYGWRGAEVGNILRFEKDFPNAKVVKLEQNYRSTSHILTAATNLIAQNQGRYVKTLWTTRTSDEKVTIKSFWNDRAEAEFVATETKQLLHYNNNKIAVLVRASFQTRILEEALIKNLVAYKIIGSVKFYERQEIKDILAYVKLTLNPNDDLSFDRIINKPTRGIGKTALEKIKKYAIDHKLSFFSAASKLYESHNTILPKAALSSLGHFFSMIYKWINDFQTLGNSKTLEMIITESGYKDLVNKDENHQSKNENIKELLKAVEEFNSITAFLEHISLVSDTDQKIDDANHIVVMTLHAAKGLEFDTVFLPGWEEGIFPHSKTLEETGTKGLEEERRLAYVGITRARNKLYISYAMNRRMYNQWLDTKPSRFLNEIPMSCCKI